MNVKNNDWVAVEYSGKTEEKEFDSNIGKEPLYFQVGMGMVIPGFDNALLNMNINDEKIVEINSKDAYGEKNDKIVELPAKAFSQIENLELNKEIELMSNMGPILIKIVEKNESTIKAILNHPLAGKDLTFKIKLLKILDEKEVKELMQEMSKHSCHCGHDHECNNCEHENSDSECEEECNCKKE